MTAAARRLLGLLVPAVTLVFSCATLGGCCPAPEDEAGTAVLQQGLRTAKVAGPYGITTGPAVGPGNGAASPITAVTVWADVSYIHGIKLWWGTKSFLIGVMTGSRYHAVLGMREYISQVYLDIDGQNWVRGISLDSTLTPGVFSVGYLSDGVVTTMTGTDARLTDATGYLGTTLGQTVVQGLTLNYTSN